MPSSINSMLPKRNRRQERQLKDLPARVGRRHRGDKVDKYAR
jgi:ribosomal protein L13